MNIPKAIEILNQQHNFRDTPYAIKLDDALKLGIEALKLVRWERTLPNSDLVALLPGETK